MKSFRDKVKKLFGLMGYSLVGTGRLTELKSMEDKYIQELPYLIFSNAMKGEGRTNPDIRYEDIACALKRIRDDGDLTYAVVRYVYDNVGAYKGYEFVNRIITNLIKKGYEGAAKRLERILLDLTGDSENFFYKVPYDDISNKYFFRGLNSYYVNKNLPKKFRLEEIE